MLRCAELRRHRRHRLWHGGRAVRGPRRLGDVGWVNMVGSCSPINVVLSRVHLDGPVAVQVQYRGQSDPQGFHQGREGRKRLPRNFSKLVRCSTVLPLPLASSSFNVDGTSSQSNPRLPKTSRCSHTIILSPSIIQPLGTTPSSVAKVDTLSKLSRRAFTRSYRFSA